MDQHETLDAEQERFQSPERLPEINKKSNTKDHLKQYLQKSMNLSKGRINQGETSSIGASDNLEDLKRENTNLRIKVHEMQAQLLEHGLRLKGLDKGRGAADKGMETTVVRANNRIFKLEATIKQKDEKIQQLSYEKKALETGRKDQFKTIDNLINDKNYLLKGVTDLQAEIVSMKKNTVHGLVDEIKALKEQLVFYEKKMKSDKDLIHKQLRTIRLLDEKNTELAKTRHITLNPLYDAAKRKDIYRQKTSDELQEKPSLEDLKELNLAFSTDVVLERVLEEQDRELEEEEIRKRIARGEKIDYTPQERKENWEQEYKKMRSTYVETRFEFEHIDGKLKQEISTLVKKLNDLEERHREKTKENERLHQALTQPQSMERPSRTFGHKKKGLRGSVSNVVHEYDAQTGNQTSFQDDVKDLLTLNPQTSDGDEIIDRNETDEYKEDTQEDENENKLREGQRVEKKGVLETVVKLGQFNQEFTFNDLEILEEENVKRIDTITLWSDKKSILGIQLKYEKEDGQVFDGPLHMGEVTKEKYKKEPWKLDEGDYLVKVRGAVAVTHGILWIEFLTKKGILVKYGNSDVGKESFTYNFEEDGVPILVTGSFSKRDRGEKTIKLNLSGLGFRCLKPGQILKDSEAVHQEAQEEEEEEVEKKEESVVEKEEKHAHDDGENVDEDYQQEKFEEQEKEENKEEKNLKTEKSNEKISSDQKKKAPVAKLKKVGK